MPSSPISPCPWCPPHAAGGHGCAVYSSSVTDAEWAILEPLLPAPGSTAGRGGRPEKHCRRSSSFNGLLAGPLDDIREQMEIHYFGTLTVTRVFAPYLRANAPAAILNVLSVLSWAHPANVGAYSAAKAAEWAQTDAVRDELAPSGVAVTALHVGFMDTDMVALVDAPKQDPAAVAAAALDGVEDGLVEVLVGDRTRQVKAGLAADRGAVAPAH